MTDYDENIYMLKENDSFNKSKEQMQTEMSEHFKIKINQLSHLKKTQETFVKWNQGIQKWENVPPIVMAHHENTLPIKTISFNILFDQIQKQNRKFSMEHVINSKNRFSFTLAKIEEMMPDIITLQEVTHLFCEMLFECKWAKENYWISHIIEEKMSFGNLVLTKIEPISLELIEIKGLARKVPTAFFNIGNSIVSFSSVHLTAYEEKSSIRTQEFSNLKTELDRFQPVVEHFILQGDMNFHREAETEIAFKHGFKDSWLEYHHNNLKDFPGFTFDSDTNHMINEIYWGFEKRKMRLDRIFILGNIKVENIKIILNDAIDKEENKPVEKVNSYNKIKGGLLLFSDYFGWNMRPEEKKYLFASDHFGLEASLSFD